MIGSSASEASGAPCDPQGEPPRFSQQEIPKVQAPRPHLESGVQLGDSSESQLPDFVTRELPRRPEQRSRLERRAVPVERRLSLPELGLEAACRVGGVCSRGALDCGTWADGRAEEERGFPEAECVGDETLTPAIGT